MSALKVKGQRKVSDATGRPLVMSTRRWHIWLFLYVCCCVYMAYYYTVSQKTHQLWNGI